MKKLKPTHLRKPKYSVPHAEIVKEVARKTGYTRRDVDEVIGVWLEELRNELLDRKMVKLRNIGTLFPMVQPPRRVTNMGGNDGDDYEDMIMQARWQIKFAVDLELKQKTQDIMVTKLDLEKIYYNDK